MKKRKSILPFHFLLVAFAALALLPGRVLANGAADVRQFGAVGDGTTNDTAAFEKAFASGAKDIYLPPGVYLIGPETLDLPAATFLHGAGVASVLKVAKETGVLFSLGDSVRMENFAVDGTDGKSSVNYSEGYKTDSLFRLCDGVDGSTIDSVRFDHCDRTCIGLDHASDVAIRSCVFRNVGIAVGITYSQRVNVLDNSVLTARMAAIQFWGNRNWKSKEDSDIVIRGNYVKDGGEGVWGTGATRVIMADNIVDGSTDVGLDLEWCDDSVISANTVRNCRSAGISLFFSCKRVSITGNTVMNDAVIDDPKAEWYVRSGIWLTYPNTDTFKGDTGHQDVSIVGNTIWCADGGPRRAIWIGSESDNVTLANNTIDGGAVWKGGINNVHPMILQKISDNIVVHRADSH